MQIRDYITVAGAARMADVTYAGILAAITRGDMTSYETADSFTLLKVKDLERWIADAPARRRRPNNRRRRSRDPSLRSG